MFSTIAQVGHVRTADSCSYDSSDQKIKGARERNLMHKKRLKVATFLDFAGFVTAVVLGALAMIGMGGLPIGTQAGGVLVGVGGMGIVHLALANVLAASLQKGFLNNLRWLAGGSFLDGS